MMMTGIALALFGLAFALQVIGVVGVVQDVRREVAASRLLAEKLPAALATGWPDPVASVLAEHSTSHGGVTPRRRWTAVGVLLAGVVLGFAGNVVALYA